MLLGRMFGLGYIRTLQGRHRQGRVAFYTIFGQVSRESLVEDTIQLSKAAIRRQALAKEAAERQTTINTVKATLNPVAPTTPVVEEEEEEQVKEEFVEDEVVEEDVIDAPEVEDTTETPTEEVEPACYLSNTGELFIRRKDNSTVELDAEESMTVIETFMMTNLEMLVARLLKARQPINKE
jgi:hypothetical protein